MFFMQDCKAMDRLMQHITNIFWKILARLANSWRTFLIPVSNVPAFFFPFYYLIISQHFFSSSPQFAPIQIITKVVKLKENKDRNLKIQLESTICSSCQISCRKVFHGFNLLHKNRKLFVFLSNITVRTSPSLITDRALHIFHFPGLQLQVSL